MPKNIKRHFKKGGDCRYDNLCLGYDGKKATCNVNPEKWMTEDKTK